MNFDQLKSKAHALPTLPGVYIMKDENDHVIYVGKAKRLKDRVSQYFQDSAFHSPKTRLMVSKIDHFDVIVCSSEFEALVLECSQIKQHKPKYNILLKDDKGYPYLRIDKDQPYPTISMVGRPTNDGAEYYGPFGSRSITRELLETIQKTLKLPSCGKKFPRDIGKDRPCLNFHMGRCAGWCQNGLEREAYLSEIDQARKLLQGHYKQVADQIRNQMLSASDDMNFELAAVLRDRLHAVELLGTKQLVTGGRFAELDAVGYGETELKACFAVLHFSEGKLIDKSYEIIDIPDDPEAAISSLIKQYYLSRGFAPKTVLIPSPIHDSDLFSQLLEREYGRKTNFLIPQRGEKVQLVRLAQANAREEAVRVTDRDARVSKSLETLGKMLKIASPRRIESFDVSNISGTDIVASMVVFQDGKPRRSEYKHFKIDEISQQDDYASMYQAVKRRFAHLNAGDSGFDQVPDLLLIDGGCTHARTAFSALEELGLSNIPVFGMVKDDRHRTRVLVTVNAEEIRIDSHQSVFSLIGNVQEETHRFAINYHRKLRNRRLRYSELDTIPGIGPKRKQMLLKKYKSLSAMSKLTLADFEAHLPKDAAVAIYSHFQKKSRGE